MPDVEDSGYANSGKDTGQQKPPTGRQSHQKDHRGSDRKNGPHDTAPYRDAMHGYSGMTLQVFHGSQLTPVYLPCLAKPALRPLTFAASIAAPERV